MHPANQDLLAQVREQSIRHPAHQRTESPRLVNVRRLQSEESWVDISSRNSTSSLSSAGADETLTPSRIAGNAAQQRRRRIQRSYSAMTQGSAATQTTAVTDSSQEEYEESESEQDPVLTSSNEDVSRQTVQSVAQRRTPLRRTVSSESSDAASIISSNDGTALGPPAESQMGASFRPQPNAFTHPPNHRHAQSYQPEPMSYFSTSAPMARAASTNAAATLQNGQTSNTTTMPGPRPAYSRANTTARPRSHTPYNMIAPNHDVSVDHDAALRASLSTLLSCAAAARGLSKRDEPSSSRATAVQAPQIAQGTLRLVPESELESQAQTGMPSQPQSRQSTQVQHQSPLLAATQRPASPRPRSPKRKSKSKSPSPSRSRHKTRASTAMSPYGDLDASVTMSPTMLWVIGAGVFVLGSAVLFSAGYAIGKEVGYVNGLSDAGAPGCRGEAGLGGGGTGLKGMGRRGWRSAASSSIWGVS